MIDTILDAARGQGRGVLTEPEGFELLRGLGIAVPRSVLVRDAAAAAEVDLDEFRGERIVVKVAAESIAHRSKVGGVAIVAKRAAAIRDAVQSMAERLSGRNVTGYTLAEFVEHEQVPGAELLLGARWTEDFGPVVTLGPGGTRAEMMAASLRPGEDCAILGPGRSSPGELAAVVGATLFGRLAAESFPGSRPLVERDELLRPVRAFLELAAATIPHAIAEIEVNPLALTERGPVAVDVLCKLGDGRPATVTPRRPLHKIGRLLAPRSIAVIGVSKRRNPGHIIVDNLIRDGFDRERIHLVKPGMDRLEGCRCYPDVESIPERVDLFVLCIDAQQAVTTLDRIVNADRAESVIAIPGGLGERSGTEHLEQAMRRTLDAARKTDGAGPVVNGGNSVGVRSRPGRYDTLFIPDHKIPSARDRRAPVAVLSQSGALMVALATKLPAVDPAYLVSIGNQTDLTVGDYTTWFVDDGSIEVVACYVEGFRPLDGARWLEAAGKITASGRHVVLYRAGHTPQGAQATASHTASIAGDYTVTRELARQAGVLVAESLADFTDLVKLFCMLSGKGVSGTRLGALSNAGFEGVAVADGERFTLAEYGERTTGRLEEILSRQRLEGVVAARNPLDLTPQSDDAAYEDAARAILEDSSVDVAVLGCVPPTGALNTLSPSPDHGENVDAETSVASRLARVAAASSKACVAVVDSGAPYDPLAAKLERDGVPTFRTMDRAVRLFGRYCEYRSQS